MERTSVVEMNWMVAVYVGCEILVAIGAIFGNSLVIIAFRRERRLRRRTNYYIVSLAVADLLVGLLGIPCALLAYYGYPKQLHACLFTVSLLVVLCTISIFSLVAVSVDRYWAILYPMGYSRNVRTKTAVGIICFCWLAGATVGFLPLLGWNAGQSGQELDECRFTKVMNYNFLVFIYFATIIFPGLLMAAFYAHIYSVVVKQLKQMVTVNGTSGGSGAMLRVLGAARKREVKATQNLSIIVLFFMVCWFPLYTINFIQAYHKDISIPEFLMDSCIILTHLNSAGNPLLYAYHLRDFRAALKAVLFGVATTEVERRVIGRDNSAYLHDLADRRRSSQLNWNGKPAKDQNLNLTTLPAIQTKLSNIQETSKNEPSIKIPTSENNSEVIPPKTNNTFFKFPLDRSLSRLIDKEKTQRNSNFTSNDKHVYTYNQLEESNASVGNELNSSTKVDDEAGEYVNKEKEEIHDESPVEEKSEEISVTPNAICSNLDGVVRETNLNMVADSNNVESPIVTRNSFNSSVGNGGGMVSEKGQNEESSDDADYSIEDDYDDDVNVKTGNEITTGIFNDCFVMDDEDSIDEVDNSILSNDKVTSSSDNRDSCSNVDIGYCNLESNDTEDIFLQPNDCLPCEIVGVKTFSRESSVGSVNSERKNSENLNQVGNSEDIEKSTIAFKVSEASSNNSPPANKKSSPDDSNRIGSASRTISLTSDKMTTFTVSNASLNLGGKTQS